MANYILIKRRLSAGGKGPLFKAGYKQMRVLGAVLFGLLFATGGVAARDCTKAEASGADSRLIDIIRSSEARTALEHRHAPFGLHESQDVATREDVLHHGGYLTLYDGDLRAPLWVSYSLARDDISSAQGKPRVECFRTDPRLNDEYASLKSDYVEPVYDRGHMTSDADLKDNLLEQLNSYVMSNMVPQHCRFNRGVWLNLENLTRSWAEEYGDIIVVSGAIYDRDLDGRRDPDQLAERMQSNNGRARVAVASAFYKVILRQDGQRWRSIAFMLPHNNDPHGTGWAAVSGYVKSKVVQLQDIESAAGTVLHPELNRAMLLQSSQGEGWSFSGGGRNFEGGCK